MLDDMPVYGWITIAALLALVAFLQAIILAQNRELEACELNRERLEQQVEWLTSRREAETVEWVPAHESAPPTPATCTRCGRPGCPHPVLTDAEAHV